MALSKEDMLLALKLKPTSDLPDDYIQILYGQVIKKASKKKNIIKVTIGKVVDKTSDKYKIALQFINKILENLKKDKINDLTDFKNIDRDDIVLDINKKTFDEMQDELFKHFNKKNCGWYARKRKKEYILTFLRKMCKELGFIFSYIQQDISHGKLRKNTSLYSIKIL